LNENDFPLEISNFIPKIQQRQPVSFENKYKIICDTKNYD